MPATAQRTATEPPAVEDVIAAAPFTPVLFNSPINRELSLYVPGTGIVEIRPDGFQRMDPAQATYINFRNGKRWATNEEELYWLRRKAAEAESHVYEADPGYSKTCRTCGRVWESQDARDDCTELHPQN